ncbi:hypothetical protein HMPREF3293_00010 [Christensenella minuta]|uniref:Uncharacterized protein n=1 Tax=Christensenella minuta TaxID=626937 RepID=A0A136Q941_9FIRM|nr:hypothetical protein HMPREF3293_00010 [Christensenella minuta]
MFPGFAALRSACTRRYRCVRFRARRNPAVLKPERSIPAFMKKYGIIDTECFYFKPCGGRPRQVPGFRPEGEKIAHEKNIS